MSYSDYIQIIIFFGVLFVLSPILGRYFYEVLEKDESPFLGWGRWLERLLYRMFGVTTESQNWKSYLKSLLAFNLVGLVVLFSIQLFQSKLPLNPQNFSDINWHLAFNTAVSFVTNTNWQSYGGESTLSYFTQMLGLGVQNFVSAAVGMAVFLVLARALRGRIDGKLGNFWRDLTRTIVYILLPLSILWSAFYISEGMIQNFSTAKEVITLEGNKQIIPQGPVASQVAIKQLGSNGGGFFNANSSHPYENPTPFTNFLSTLALILIAAASCFTYGEIIGSKKQGRILFGVMTTLFSLGLVLSLWSEFSQSGTLMEGKEQRIGVANSILYSVATTAASNGSVNAMMSSLSPLSGAVGLVNMMLGEVVFGGVGAGLYGMILFVIMTVFIAGLMVGRTPEYLGKKIEAKEIFWTLAGCVIPGLAILVFTAIAVQFEGGLSSISSKGPHAFTEVLYAFTSAAANNGSAFAGLNANTVFYNVTLGIAMLIGRFGVIIPVFFVASSLVSKKRLADSVGTFRTDTWIFGTLLILVILLVGALTFLPALALGPILEHLLLTSNILL